MTLTDVCFKVCTALDKAGTVAVLVGGSAATYYAPEAYQSDDVDFIIRLGGSSAAVEALERIGFKEREGLYYSDETRYTLEFPAGPLMVGDDYISNYATVRRDDEVLYVLQPYDSVRDRLLWYYHYRDYSALNAAAAVAARNDVDIGSLRAWSVREGAPDKFESFVRQVRERRQG